MKKILFSLLLLTFILLPKNVMAASEGFSVNKTSVTINNNGTVQITITAYNAIGDVTITSSDPSIVTTSAGTWATGVVEAGATKTETIVLTGKSVGTTTVTLKVDGSLFTTPATRINETITINVTVAEAPIPINSYTITYNANGGENAPTEQTKEKDKVLMLHTAKPTREGYEFVEWNTKSDGSGTKYSAGGNYTSNSNVTLYAQWKKTGNVTTNPNTGDTIIYILLLLTLGALIYSYWYMKKIQEN